MLVARSAMGWVSIPLEQLKSLGMPHWIRRFVSYFHCSTIPPRRSCYYSASDFWSANGPIFQLVFLFPVYGIIYVGVSCRQGYQPANHLCRLIFYLPFYFQAVKGTTAEESGIRTIAFLISIVVSSILVGVGITVIGIYKPFMIFGGCVFTVCHSSTSLYDLPI